MIEQEAFDSGEEYSDQGEAPSGDLSEVLVRFQCLDCLAKYEVLYRQGSRYGEPEYCPYCGKRTVKRDDESEENN
jgi:predicted RNA-binding Zn-ribbon protein involved in translation (DUF1610 family)